MPAMSSTSDVRRPVGLGIKRGLFTGLRWQPV